MQGTGAASSKGSVSWTVAGCWFVVVVFLVGRGVLLLFVGAGAKVGGVAVGLITL